MRNFFIKIDIIVTICAVLFVGSLLVVGLISLATEARCDSIEIELKAARVGVEAEAGGS